MLEGIKQKISRRNADNEAHLSFDALRRYVGYLAFALVPVLILLSFFEPANGNPGLQSSISDHYHTQLGRDVFVSILCAIGAFFFCYRPYGNALDTWLGRTAGFFVVVTALVRTTPNCSESRCLDAPGLIHLASAGIFFICLAIYCLFFFVQTKNDAPPSAPKRRRNKIFRICGYCILTCIGLIGVISVMPSLRDWASQWRYVFILEAVSVFAFAIAWVIKGKLLDHWALLKGRLYD
jgi:Protein of unknown function (DUF998)